jgi:hypothetical protein
MRIATADPQELVIALIYTLKLLIYDEELSFSY